jgi:2-polyprenyl-6-methoxyphenol hydroxylase-like FAD-dependent oxidoreductase
LTLSKILDPGLTCTELLEQHGFSPDVVEKTDSYSGLGYVLGLWPAESNILQGLGTYERSRSHADPMHMYTLSVTVDAS